MNCSQGSLQKCGESIYHSLTKSDMRNLLVFLMFLTFFFPHFMPKCDRSDLLLEKSESLFRYFAHIKRAICSKNQRAKSQSCKPGFAHGEVKQIFWVSLQLCF